MSSASRLASARVAWASRWACSRISCGVAQRGRADLAGLLLGQAQHCRGAAAEAGVRRVLVLLELTPSCLERGLELADLAVGLAEAAVEALPLAGQLAQVVVDTALS
jgi:hypothetical protein